MQSLYFSNIFTVVDISAAVTAVTKAETALQLRYKIGTFGLQLVMSLKLLHYANVKENAEQ